MKSFEWVVIPDLSAGLPGQFCFTCSDGFDCSGFSCSGFQVDDNPANPEYDG